METKTLGILIALSIALIISGAYLMSYTTIRTETISGISIPYGISWPYALPGDILVAVGGILLSISSVLLVGTLLIREAKAPTPSIRRKSPAESPKIKAGKQKIVEVEESGFNFRLMTDIIAGIVLIVIGILAKLIANESTDSGVISIGNWTLIACVIIGMLIIGFGIADYAIDKKRK